MKLSFNETSGNWTLVMTPMQFFIIRLALKRFINSGGIFVTFHNRAEEMWNKLIEDMVSNESR